MNQWFHFASLPFFHILPSFHIIISFHFISCVSFGIYFHFVSVVSYYIYIMCIYIYWVLSMCSSVWRLLIASIKTWLIHFYFVILSHIANFLSLSRVSQFDINKIETNMYFDDFWLNILCALCKISLIFFNFFVDFFFLLVFCIFIIAFFVVYNLQMCVCVFFSVLIICFLNAFHLYERWSAFHLWNNLLHSHYFIIHRHLIILICKSMLHAIISFFTLHFVWIYINSN